ncbi:M1 family metallopeptidase [Nocardioides sp. CPCC 206347]|uniref:M1 family metallopeptidase n=1 Tax=unclassified Nocardioides TaxID=2615069 RepID=UPI0036079644
MRWRTVLVVFLLLLVPGLSGAAATVPGASATVSTLTTAPAPGGIRGSDPYWPYDGNGGTDALHYDVRIAYDFGERILRGRTVVTLRANRALSSFSLDLLLPVSAVRVNGWNARFTRPNHHELKVVPRSAIGAGKTFKVEVVYRGRPSRVGYAGERNWLADRHEFVTMNQPHMAPWWFPSNDHPSDKATFDIRVTLPKAKRVISNGVRVSRTVVGTRAVTHWRMSDPMATYLAVVAAGDFVFEASRTASGIPVYNAVSSRLSLGERRRALRVLRRTAGITEGLQGQFGPYPFSSIGGVVTNLDVGFALENQTRPTYGSWIDTDVIVHEVAHQWFGDSVSVRKWRDIWLNEGFATYAEVLYDAAHGGPSVEAWLDEYYADACQTPRSSFWTLKLDNPGAAHIFDSAVYDRGAMVLAALRNRIGAAEMERVLRLWVTAHHDGNASVAQFEAFVQARTGEILDTFFDAWLRGSQAPAGTLMNGLQHACP